MTAKGVPPEVMLLKVVSAYVPALAVPTRK